MLILEIAKSMENYSVCIAANTKNNEGLYFNQVPIIGVFNNEVVHIGKQLREIAQHNSIIKRSNSDILE